MGGFLGADCKLFGVKYSIDVDWVLYKNIYFHWYLNFIDIMLNLMLMQFNEIFGLFLFGLINNLSAWGMFVGYVVWFLVLESGLIRFLNNFKCLKSLDVIVLGFSQNSVPNNPKTPILWILLIKRSFDSHTS